MATMDARRPMKDPLAHSRAASNRLPSRPMHARLAFLAAAAAAAVAAALPACGGSSASIDASSLPPADADPNAPDADPNAPDATPPGTPWRPTSGTTWAWQLSGSLDTSIDVAMYDVDLFTTSAAQIDALHADG